MSYKEEALVAEAAEVLGGEANILAAGVFGLAGLTLAATAGVVAGGAVGDAVTDAMPDGGGAAGAIGRTASAVLGDIAAKHAYAESQGASVQLLVAVTDRTIEVINRDHDDLPPILATFDRATCEITITKMGLSRKVTLRDTTSDQSLKLTGAGGGFSPLAKGDKLVLALLSD